MKSKKTKTVEPILQTGQEMEWTDVGPELIIWAKRIAGNRGTFYQKYRDHGQGDFVPCENMRCQKVLGVGERALTVNWKVSRHGRIGKQVFCCVECQQENLKFPAPRFKPVIKHE